MFSHRTVWNHEKNALTQLLEVKRQRGEPIVDLTLSNPTLADFKTVTDQILQPLSNPRSLTYDPRPFGLSAARAAVTEYYRSQQISVDPANILLTASTSEAYSFLLRLLCNPGDEILVPTPSYPLFEFLAQLHDVSLKCYRLAYDGEWHVHLDSLREVITPKTRAIVLLHPNNPTGSFIRTNERDAINRIATSHNIPLIVDEVFHAYSFDGNPPASFASNTAALTFTLNGISKLFGLPQMKLAWTVISGPSHLVEESRSRLDIIADTFLSVNAPVQSALPSYFDHLLTRTEEVRKRVRENYAGIRSLVAGSPVTVLECHGGWSAVLRLPLIHSDETWALKLLERHGVLTHPGGLFGFEENSYLVVSLLPPSYEFTRGIQIMRNYVEEEGN
jgi:alanine-synthesizing transaminase